jgi:hypothetical protein
MTLSQSYPKDNLDGPGYQTIYQWTLTDTCGNQDTGLDQHEEFGSWTDDYYASTGVHNTWIMHRMRPGAAFDVASSTC